MFAKDGYSTLLFVTLLVISICFAASFLNHWTKYLIYGSFGVLLLIVFYFFRDPDRTTPDNINALIAPADGKIILLKEVYEPVYLKDDAIQISIFLNLLDVHVNRIPVTGLVEYEQYHPGEYLVAWHEKASEKNERADFGIQHASGTKVFFRQITGLVARRIVYRITEGDSVQAGNRFGMMKFGSRMDILVPKDVRLTVKKGDRTVGGETILGVINRED